MYQERINEQIQEDKFLRDFQKMKGELESLGILFSIQYSPKSNTIILYKIFVKQFQRNSGVGSTSMYIITSLADEYGKMVSLVPSDIFGSDLNRLKKFYLKFDFQEVSENYLRYPK